MPNMDVASVCGGGASPGPPAPKVVQPQPAVTPFALSAASNCTDGAEPLRAMLLVDSRVQDLEPEVRTFNTAIIACNMCGQPQEALKVCLLWTRR